MNAEKTLGNRVTALMALALLALQFALGPSTVNAVGFVVPALTVGLAVLASLRGTASGRVIAVLVALISVATKTGAPWQLVMLVALAALLGLGRWSPRFALDPAWRARGRVRVGWTVLVGGVTPVALGAWFVLFRPDVKDIFARYIPDVPFVVLVLGGVVFAIVNATLEELIWRGVFQNRLEAAFGPGLAIVIQAISFAIQHAWGFPRGVVGVLLAGTWALMLGALRRSSGGLLGPILAHVVADATIAVILLGVAH